MSRPKINGVIQGWSGLIIKIINFIDTLPESESRAARMLKGSLRDLWFHFWHECALPEDSYFSATDIDFVESTRGRIVALIEVKPFDKNPSSYQIGIYAKISMALKIPFYIIRFGIDMEKPFRVDCYVGQTLQKSKTLSEEELMDFYYEIRGMKRQKNHLQNIYRKGGERN